LRLLLAQVSMLLAISIPITESMVNSRVSESFPKTVKKRRII